MSDGTLIQGYKLLSKALPMPGTAFFSTQRILRPLLVSIFQGEADGDGFGSKFLLKTRFFSETDFPSTPDDFKTIFGIDFSRRSRW